ncbi:Uncharacterised protein [Mycobacterium tuberculosis]|nr:Uncharacterised protein [Mycobacterium tuberculosis]
MRVGGIFPEAAELTHEAGRDVWVFQNSGHVFDVAIPVDLRGGDRVGRTHESDTQATEQLRAVFLRDAQNLAVQGSGQRVGEVIAQIGWCALGNQVVQQRVRGVS